MDNNKICCVAVCTAKRPLMLTACLESLIRQTTPFGWNTEIIVVDNEEEQKANSIVRNIASRSLLPISYCHEPKKGIPFARNRALDEGIRKGADWIAFIDDDEVADDNWLQSLISVANKTQADVLHGHVKYNYPDLCRLWMKSKKGTARKTGDVLVTCSTNNVMLRSHLVHPNGLGVRFDEEMALTGGSDTYFFYNATDKGARIIYVAEAIVTENVPVERCSFKWRMKRSYRCSANASSIEIKRKGYLTSAMHLVPKFFMSLIEGIVICLFLPLLLIHTQSFRRYFLKAGGKFSYALGIVAAYMKRLPTPYKNIEGC